MRLITGTGKLRILSNYLRLGVHANRPELGTPFNCPRLCVLTNRPDVVDQRHNHRQTPNFFILITICISLVFAVGCNSGSTDETADVNAKARVKATTIQLKDLNEFEFVPATVVYLNKSDIVAPVSGYITKAKAQTGYPVAKGQLLFSLETKEHRVINQDTTLKDEGIRSLGVYTVKAPENGYITDVAHQQGDYVQEGTPLCSFTRSDQIYVKAFVPVRLQSVIQKNKECQIILPDNKEIKAVIGETMHELDAGSQSLQVLIKPLIQTPFAENMNMQVKLPVEHVDQAQVVPKAAVLSNERLDKFWIMQLLNDSVAVKVLITTGIVQNDSVQIVQPVFNKDTKILYEGNYGLPDTAKVKLQQ